MSCSTPLQHALSKGNIAASLCEGSTDKALIIDLQNTLYELGFKEELNWDKYHADGFYGASTKNAVLAFAKKNDLETDGTKVTDEMAKLIIQRHSFLPSLYILWSIKASNERSTVYLSKASRVGLTALQILLNKLGYGAELNWEKYNADGFYGKSTKNAVLAFARDQNIESDGDHLSKELVDQLLVEINKYYGPSWTELAKGRVTSDEGSPFAFYEASNFTGNPCKVDTLFVPMLDKINDYAKQADVEIYVTSAFRSLAKTEALRQTKTVVPPARKSNHMVGHAIDMNIRYKNAPSDSAYLMANSRMLAKYPNVPAPVKQFLDYIIEDGTLRWGGKFRTPDVVHIDDGLNVHNKAKWDERYCLMQETALGLK